MQWRGEASACLSHAVLRFTEDQDLRVTAGVRAPLTQHSVGQPEPFLRVQARRPSGKACAVCTLDAPACLAIC